MTTLDAIIAAGRRPGVQVYSPGRALPPALTGRQTSQQYNQARRQAESTPPVTQWSNLASKYINSPENQQAQVQQAQAAAQKKAMDALPAWKRTIANVVTNPVVSMGLGLLSEPMKLVDVGLEEGVKLLPDSWEQRLYKPFGTSDNKVLQALNSGATGGLFGMDPAKTHDGQSIGSRLAPRSNYGAAEIYGNDSSVPGMTGLRNLVSDVSHDPLTYLSFGGERVAVDAAELARTAALADEANAALTAAKASFAAPDVIANADRAAQEAAMAARRGATPVRTAIPHTQKARADLVAELVVHDPALSEKFSSELATGVRKGFRFMSPEARDAIGVDRIGIKNTFTGSVIPGTETLTKPFTYGGNLVRETLSKALPSGAVRGSEEVAKILEGSSASSKQTTAALASGVLSGKVAGPYDLAAAHRWTVNQGRMLEGQAKNLGGRALVDTVKTALKKTNAAEREALVYEAETTPTKTPLNDLAGRILGINEAVSGRTIDPQYLKNTDTYMPHILEPKFRRVLKRALEKGTDEEKARAAAFLDANGMKVQDLLETSGHLDKARKLTTNNGAPRVISLGKNGSAGKLIITDDTIRGLNNNVSMRNYFSGYTGKFYMDDPIKIFDAYNSSLARDAGRRGSVAALGRTPSAVAHNVEGDLADALTGYQEALPRQSDAYRTMETVRANPHTPGSDTFVVPDAPPVPASTPFFAPVEGTNATGEVRQFFAGKGVPGPKGGNVNEAKQYIGQVQQEIADSMDPISRNLYDMRTNMMVGLRNETSATSDQIKAVEKIIRTFRGRVDGLGSLSPANTKEFEALLNATDKHIMDLRQELAARIRTYGPQSKYEENLVASLEGQIADVERGARSSISRQSRKVGKEIDEKLAKNLAYFEDTRVRLLKKINDGPIVLRDELLKRNEELFAPVREAQQILDTKVASFVAPHTPEEVSAARRTIGDSTSMNAEYVDASEKYRRALIERQQHLDSAPKNKAGGLTKAAQTKLDEIDSRIKSLRTDLSVGIPRGVTNPNAESKAYEEARLELNRLRHQATEAAPAEQAGLAEKIARIEQRFNQRGDLYEQQKARDVLAAHKKYTEDVATGTQRETASVTTARRIAEAQPERVVTSPEGRVLKGTEGIFEGKNYRQVGPMATPPFPETALGQEPRTEAGQLHYLNTKYGRVIEDRLKQIEEILGTDTTEGSRQVQARTLSAETKKSTRAAIRTDVAAQVKPTLDNLNAQRDAAAQQLALTQGLHKSDVARLRGRLDTIAQVMPHLSDRNQLMEYRDEVKRVLAELRPAETNPKNYSTPNEMLGVVDDIQAIATENPLLSDPALVHTEAQLNFYRKELQRLEGHDMTVSDMQGMRRAAQVDKTFGKTLVAGMASGWSLMRDGENVLPEVGDIIVDSRLKQMFQNTYNAIDQPGLLGRWFNEATNMFKTYATLTPGFHMRNMLSGMFMNASDGVGLPHQIEGLKLWQQFTGSDEKWLSQQSERVQKAFAATFGSGAGGRYTETGIGQRTGNSFLDKAVDNWATRKSAALGQRVEGGMRLGMALNSVDNGESVQQALARITRIHFDYSQVSQLDQTMKRIIPFWTFMSRNLPLQITQMYMNPAAYQAYNHLVANFSVPNDPNTPAYWAKLGTWNTGLKIGGMPLYFQPDFGFTRLGTDISTLTDPGQMLANVNPVFAAPVDWAQHRDSFYDRSFGPTDFHHQSGVVGTPLSIVAGMLPGQTNEAGQVSDNFTNLVRGLVPPIDQISRLFPGALGGGGDQQRQGEAIARYFGAPVRTLSDKQIATEKKNKIYAARDEQARRRKMAEAILAG